MSSTQALLAAAVLVALAQSAPAQRQFDELGKRGLPADQDSTNAVARGDVDGDGDLDLVLGNGHYNSGFYIPPDQQNRLYLNDGTGTFTDATAARLPVDDDFTTCVALGDVDGDGDLDMVFGNYGQNRLYLNNGTGTFTDGTVARMPVDFDETTAVALGDVDGDGDLDMVFGNDGQQQNRLYLNNGTGNFTDATATRMPVDLDDTRAVAMGDLDGDGDLDMMLGNDGQKRLFLNNGTGTFTDVTAARMPVDNDRTYAVALGDVEGDGDLDLVFGNYGQNRLYVNNGTGTFTDATAGCMPVNSYGTSCVALGDVDGDGDLDLVFGNRTQQNLYLNNGTGTFTDATAGSMPVASYGTFCVALGDVEGDGDLDIVFGNGGTGGPHYYGRQNRLYLNNGTGTFADATAGRMPGDNDSTRAVALGDVDGDGDLDMVFGNIWQDRLYLNNGTGTFTDATAARLPIAGYWTTCVALGDVDGDGDLDLVFGNRPASGTSSQNRLYLNNGTGTFTDVTAARMPVASYYTTSVALGDVDGDGDLDLVFGNGGQQNRLYLNNGTGTFTDVTAAHMPVDSDDTTCVALGDVNNDGHLDLVFGNGGSGGPYYSLSRNRLYLNNGTGAFADVTASRMPSYFGNTTAVVMGDVDGDGDLDLVFGDTGYNVHFNYVSGQDRLYLNNGTGTFANVTSPRMPVDNDDTRGVALHDVDRDGDLDLVLGNYPQNRLCLNLVRQLDAPFLLRVGRTYRLDVYARYGPPRLVDVAGACLSTATATIPLPPWGTLGIDPNYAMLLPGFVIPPAAGVGSVAITVPNVASLAGVSIYGQALLIQYPTQDRLTNVTADVIWH